MTEPATIRPERDEERKEDLLSEVTARIAEDAKEKAEAYLRDTIVPEGGE